MVYSIIPARSGSKGVPGKNIRLLGGYPLIAYSIAASKMSRSIQRTIVSTDTEEIAKIARSFGAQVPFLRPAEYAADRSLDIDFVLHALKWLKENNEEPPDYLVNLRPTTPLRDPQLIDRAVEDFKRTPTADSMRSGHPAAESPMKWFKLEDSIYFKNYAGLSIEDADRPRQEFPTAYIPDGYVDIYRSEFVLKEGRLYGDTLKAFISPVCTEVDREDDFDYLEFQLEKSHSTVLEYLNKNFPTKGV